jgi:hypothetical protein
MKKYAQAARLAFCYELRCKIIRLTLDRCFLNNILINKALYFLGTYQASQR